MNYLTYFFDKPDARNSYTMYNRGFSNTNVLEAKLTLKTDDIDEFEVKINPKNRGYDHIKPFQTHVEIWAFDENTKTNGKLIFRGRALKPTKSMADSGAFTQSYTFESIEAYLLDSLQRFVDVTNYTAKDLLNMLIAEHNAQLPEYKQFTVRTVDVDGQVVNTDGQGNFIQYEKTRDVMKRLLRDQYGGHFRVEYKDGKNYLDYVKDPGKKHDKGPAFELGVNVKSASVVLDPTKAITVLVPLGAEEGGDDGDGDGDGTGGRAEEVIAYAKKFLGKPYIWGGTRGVDPGDDVSGFPGTDCSGLTSVIYKHFGITIGTYTVAQESDVRPISRSEVQTGDLGFVGPHGGTTHVVMALDNKTLIQESSYAEPCNIRDIDTYPHQLWWGRNDQMAALVASEGGVGKATGVTTAQNGDWGPAIKNAAHMMNAQIDDNYVNRVKSLIQHESGGNETIQNNWDINAQRGTPSIGLIQYIQPTFDKYKVDGYGDIRKGFHQLLALFNDSNYLTDVRLGGWGPTGSKRMDKPAKSGSKNNGGGWAWPFPAVGEGTFAGGQLFGVHPGGEFRQNGFHDGLDFGSLDHPGREVHAVHGGTVDRIGYMSGLEFYCVVHSGDGYNVVYQEAFSNQGNIIVKVGQKIKTGDIIGYRDTSHLHLGITKTDFMLAVQKSFTNDGTWLDPQPILRSGVADDSSDGSDDDDSDKKEQGPRPRITIAPVNDGKDFIEIKDLMTELTPLVDKQVWDDIKDPQELKDKAEEWIKNQQAISTQWTVSAFELPQLETFNVFDSYNFKVPQLAKEQALTVTQKVVDLTHPYKSSIMIADKVIKLSDYQLEMKAKLNEVDELKSQVKSQSIAISESTGEGTSAKINDLYNSVGSINVPQLKKDYDGTSQKVATLDTDVETMKNMITQMQAEINLLKESQPSEGGGTSGV